MSPFKPSKETCYKVSIKSPQIKISKKVCNEKKKNKKITTNSRKLLPLPQFSLPTFVQSLSPPLGDFSTNHFC